MYKQMRVHSCGNISTLRHSLVPPTLLTTLSLAAFTTSNFGSVWCCWVMCNSIGDMYTLVSFKAVSCYECVKRHWAVNNTEQRQMWTSQQVPYVASLVV